MFAVHFAVQQFVAAWDTPQPACLQSPHFAGLTGIHFLPWEKSAAAGSTGRRCSQKLLQRVPMPGVQGCSAEVRAVQSPLPSAGEVHRELAAWKEVCCVTAWGSECRALCLPAGL